VFRSDFGARRANVLYPAQRVHRIPQDLGHDAHSLCVADKRLSIDRRA